MLAGKGGTVEPFELKMCDHGLNYKGTGYDASIQHVSKYLNVLLGNSTLVIDVFHEWTCSYISMT